MITTPTRTLDEDTALPPAPAVPTDTRSWLAERISTETAALLAATWYVLFLIGTALEPRSSAATPAWVSALTIVFFGLLLTAAAGLVSRRRWGVMASLGAAGLFSALAVACPASAHHSIAAWWFGQMACALGLVAASVIALRRPAV